MSRSTERTPDGRHVVVDGRRWRATDPSIPGALVAELVRELMAARRVIRASGGDPAARRRVHDAKVALGERGEPWWEAPTAEGRDGRIASTIRALLRARRGGSICPSDAARAVGSPDWRPLMDNVRSVGVALAAREEVAISSSGEEVTAPWEARGPLRYHPGPEL